MSETMCTCEKEVVEVAVVMVADTMVEKAKTCQHHSTIRCQSICFLP